MAYDFGALLHTITTMSIWIGLVIAVLVIVWFVLNRKKYWLTLVIYTRRAEGQSAIRFDKGGLFKLKGGARVLKILKSKHNIEPPGNEFFWKMASGKTIIHLRQIGTDVYKPFNPTFETDKEQAFVTDLNIDDTLAWKVNTADQIKKALDWNAIWEKYGGLITLLICAVIFIVVIFLVLKFVQTTVTSVSSPLIETKNWLQKIFESQAAGGGTTGGAP